MVGLIDMAFFLHKTGFYMVKGGQQIVPIGRGKVDRTFWAEFDEANFFRCSATGDAVRGLYIFAYPASGNSGTPNRLLIYNWFTERWARAQVTCEIVFGGVSQVSVTLRVGRLRHGNPIRWIRRSGRAGIAAAVRLHFQPQSEAFSGVLEATVETASSTPAGTRSIIRSCRPLIDGGSPMIKIGSRETQQTAVVYGDEVGLTVAGMAPVYQSGRYFRARARIPAASVWSNMQGIDDLDVRPAGGQ